MELILSTALSQNGVWKDGMIDLDFGSMGTNTNSEKDLKSSKGSGVEIGSGSGSKSRSWNSSPHLFSHNGMWLSKISYSSSRMSGMGVKTDSKILLKSGSKIGVNIDLEIWTESQIWDSRSHYVKMRICQFVNMTFKSMKLVKFNMMIIKDW